MPIFQATIQHDDKTFESLAHMQYDLFCRGNRVARTILSIAAILLGIAKYESWWGILAIGYGCYLSTSTYSSANHTAHKLANGIRSSGMQFPSSRYEFTDECVRIISRPEQEELGEPLGYSTFEMLGEDWSYFYLFPNPHGGYMIPKTEIDDLESFREFIQRKTGKRFQRKMPPVAKFLQKLKDREQEPYHL